MRVQALHAGPSTADAARSLHRRFANGRLVAALGVIVVGSPEVIGIDEFLETVHSAVAFETADGVVQFAVDEPVEGGHRRTVTKVGFILDNDRPSVDAANRYAASSRQRTAQRLLYRGEIVGRRVTKGAQRQNSRVRTKRERKPFAAACLTGRDADELESEETDDGDTRGANPGSPVLAETCPALLPGSTWMRL